MKKPHALRIEISWLDAVYDDDSPNTEGMPCKEIGYLVSVTPTYIEIAREWGPEIGTFRFHMKIPRKMVQNVAVLKVGKATALIDSLKAKIPKWS